MKKAISVLLVLVVVTGACVGYIGKSDEALIEDRMEAFLKAYNSGDMEGVFACLDAKSRNMYQARFVLVMN